MIPYKLLQIDNMPYNQNGKIDRKKLPNIDFSEDDTAILPENDDEKLILDSFRKTLK